MGYALAETIGDYVVLALYGIFFSRLPWFDVLLIIDCKRVREVSDNITSHQTRVISKVKGTKGSYVYM